MKELKHISGNCERGVNDNHIKEAEPEQSLFQPMEVRDGQMTIEVDQS